ncbi:MAG: tryptophan--tRNA ligase [Proteobacteria bacterium]|nr:tryptophan--tRNA ligase [Pseudomonadota bacterium]
MTIDTKPKRIFSGIQPTGDVHIGNYLGAIQNWVKLTEEYDCIYCIVDYHAVTIDYEPPLMQQKILDTALICIACGLTRDKCTLFVQSHIPEHTELTWVFNCLTPIGDLERMTQFKQKGKQHRKNINMGLLDYPVLQAADILIYKAGYVPVGKDQYQHVELTREIARKFNARFGHVFPEPVVLESKAPKILGLDGKSKMSKSMNNTIGLLESPEAIWEKLRIAVTDVNRVRRHDPGNPRKCNIYSLHRAFSSPEEVRQIAHDCRTAAIGCIDCKKILWKNMVAHLKPIQERAADLQRNIGRVKENLTGGADRCREIASGVMDEVRDRMGLTPTNRNV